MGRVLYLDEWLAAPADRVRLLGLLDAATVRRLREGKFTDYGCEWVAAQTSNQALQQTAGADRFQGLHRPKKPFFAWFRYQKQPWNTLLRPLFVSLQPLKSFQHKFFWTDEMVLERGTHFRQTHCHRTE